MPDQITVQPLHSAQLTTAAMLYKTVFNQAPWLESWTKSTAKKRLDFLFNMPSSFHLCILKNTKLLGFLIGYTEPYLDKTMLHLKELCIAPTSQNKGFATQLLNQLESNCIKQNINAVYLSTKKTKTLTHFYTKNNYQSLDQHIIFFKDLPFGDTSLFKTV